jgi:L-ribulokinase
MSQYSVGFDFGTESVRVVIVDVSNGRVAGQASRNYAHGVIDDVLPDGEVKLPPDYALQHPSDWLNDSAAACKEALTASGASAEQVIGIGVDFTSCTMMPAFADGTPVCLFERFGRVPLAYPKLWKHHAAKAETDRINDVARQRNEPWLQRYGGTVGLEWFFPKVLETLNHEPGVYDIADVWLEAGDWFVWQLVDGPFPKCSTKNLSRSTCQAGYKAMWNGATGFPTPDYFAAVHPKLRDVVAEKMPGQMLAPGARAGTLSPAAAELFGLKAGTPVSAATIDAHAGVPGAGVADASTMVLVMGTSSCHMMNASADAAIPGVAGVVQDGILPGLFGIETGQASVGDAFAWLVETFELSHARLTREAGAFGPGSGGVIALDWLNGCRTPLMDGRLSGAFLGLTLGTQPAQLYRALMEATAMGVRWIVETIAAAHVPVERFVASGGLPTKSPLLMQIYADVLNKEVALAESDQSVALGAAILGVLASGAHGTGPAATQAIISRMARQRTDLVYRPNPEAAAKYDRLYAMYRDLADPKGVVANTMRKLREM